MAKPKHERENPRVAQDERIFEARAALANKVAAHCGEGVLVTGVPGLSLYRQSTPTACTFSCLRSQAGRFCAGPKRINVGDTSYLCDAVVSVFHGRFAGGEPGGCGHAGEPLLGLLMAWIWRRCAGC